MSALICSMSFNRSTSPWLLTVPSTELRRWSIWSTRWRSASMRLRASSSSKSAARAIEAVSISARNRTAGVTTPPSLHHRMRSPLSPLLRTLFPSVNHVVATVLRPGTFVVTGVPRFFLAEAHRLDLRIGCAIELHHPLDVVGATLTECDVVLAAAAFVAVALDGHLRCLVAQQVFCVRFDQRLVLVLDVVLVEVEVHAALGQHAARILERIPSACSGTTYASAGGACRRRATVARRWRAFFNRHAGFGFGCRLAAAQQPEHADGGQENQGGTCGPHWVHCRLSGFRCYFCSGPHAGSRTSVDTALSRCFTRPSLETAANIPRAPSSDA